MTASSWLRVAAGVRLVASAAAKQASQDASSAAARTAQHGIELAANLRHVGAMQQQHHQHHAEEPSRRLQKQPHINGTEPLGFPSPTAKKATTATANVQTPIAPIDNHETTTTTASKPLPINPLFHASKAEAGPPPPVPYEVAEQVGQANETATITPDPSTAAADNSIITPLSTSDSNVTDDDEPPHTDYPRLQEGRAVPSTRVARAFGFASLGLGLAVGTMGEGLSRLTGTKTQHQEQSSTNLVMNDANADRLAASLCRMRGAALKMGQMLSIQDESLLPPPLTRALKQVRQGADAMPQYQLQQQLQAQLGDDWLDKRFVTFDKLPFAAASVGQCHRATIIPHGHQVEPQNVVVKVQYPGVGRSIESDLQNLAMLIQWTGMAPKGLFLDNVIRVGKEELQVECDYQREMAAQLRMKELVESDPILVDNKFVVPQVFPHLSTSEVITTAYCPGGTIDKVSHLDQEERNRIARTIMYMTIQELFVWRFMQTDPNWGNFLYDVGTQTTSLIDFGATREYSKEFVDGYLRIVWASANQDEERLMAQSYKMKFLTGEENDIMLHAHKQSGYTVGEPFRTNDEFDFRGSQLSTRMGQHTSVFLQHRLT
jgi:aarF domain-containing kinase